MAEELSIRVPQTREIFGEADLLDWFSKPQASGVLKRDATWGGNGVKIAHSLLEAREAWATLGKPLTAATACKLRLVNHDPLAFWKWRSLKETAVTLQQFIVGRPANTMMVCRDGLAERLHPSGFHGLDFVIEEETSFAHLIELNPRCTQLGHLGIAAQGDLAAILCNDLTGFRRGERSGLKMGDTIAFFPQAIRWMPGSIHLQAGYVDAPTEEPGLMEELERECWPERQFLARIYHSIRRPKTTPTVMFEEFSSQVG